MTSTATRPVPTEARYLLPVEAYTSQEWFDREQQELFGRCWYFAGVTHELAAPGDYLTVDVGFSPIVVVRDAEGGLRAFHNVCPHRGAQLLTGTGNVRHGITCFYHSWSFGLDGGLRRVPQPDQFPGLDLGALGLRPAGLGVHKGLVFVHPEPDAAPLAEWIADFPERMGPYEPERLVQLGHQRHEVRANWKLFVENHIDGYHLWHLHAKSIRGLDHRAQVWQPMGRHWTFYEPVADGHAPPDAATGLPYIDHMGERWHGSSVHLLFPNLGVAGGATFFATLQAVPVAPDRSIADVRFFTMPIPEEDRAAHRDEAAAGVLAGPGEDDAGSDGGDGGGGDADDGGGDFVAEDIFAVEQIQRTLRSPRFRVGPMAAQYESSITFFHENVLDYVPLPDGG